MSKICSKILKICKDCIIIHSTLKEKLTKIEKRKLKEHILFKIWKPNVPDVNHSVANRKNGKKFFFLEWFNLFDLLIGVNLGNILNEVV